MDVQRVVTNETCNQNCWFCNARRPAGAAGFIRAAVRSSTRRSPAIHAIVHRRRAASAISPTHAAPTGGRRVVLETNGALIDAARARGDRGLAHRASNSSRGTRRRRAITCVPGGRRRARRFAPPAAGVTVR
jgi:hypothetical protein